ncbi:MAG: hypothetical protein ACHQWU_04975 [Gemmatimonadales bacterium]
MPLYVAPPSLTHGEPAAGGMLIVTGSSRSRFSRGRSLASFVQTTPIPPQAFVDTTFPTFNGTVWNVTDNTSMNTALANAVGGDVIVIANGTSLTGQFNLRARSDTQYLGIVDQRIHAGTFPRTPGDAVSNQLLRPFQRTRPSDFASVRSKLTATSANLCITTDPGAAYYWFAGLEISGPASATGGGVALIDIRDQTGSVSDVNAQPHHIIFDRCYIHGTNGVDTRRGLLMNGQSIAAIDCWFEECHQAGFDSNGIACWNGAGPFKIVNCYVAASTENIIFGGADPAVFGLVPSDIEVDLCHLWKDPAWITDGFDYTIKNLYEHKNGRRARIQRCVLENCWQQAQTGNAFLFQPLTDNNTAPWTSITDLTISYVLVKGAGTGIVMSSRVAFDNPGQPGTGVLPTTPLSRVNISNVLLRQIGLRTPANGFPTVNDGGRLMQITGDFQYITVDHVTGKAPVDFLALDSNGLGPPTGFVMTRGLYGRGDFGMFGSNKGEGSAGLIAYGGSDFKYKEVVLYDSNAAPGDGAFEPSVRYPGLDPSNSFIDLGFPGSENAVGFTNPAGDDWSLSPTSPFKGAGSDGLDLGCDVPGLNAAIANVVQSR